MAPKRKYTDEQLAYLKKYYRKYPTKLVAEQLGIKEPIVRALAQRHGLSKNKRRAKAPLPEFNKPLQPLEETQRTLKVLERLHNPTEKQLQDAIRRHTMAPVPRKNWFQCLVSWLLEGKV